MPPSLSRLDRVLERRRGYCDRAIDRSALTKALLESHRRRGAPAPVLQSVERLNDRDTFLIVTGQQPGLLGGPFYTLYKILQTIALASRLNRERSENFIPAFWNAADDHDFDEIATIHWLSKNKDVVSYTWPGDSNRRIPFFQIPQSACPLSDLLNVLKETKRPTEFTDEIIGEILSCADSAHTYPDFFDRLIWRFLPDDGLLVLRPDDLFVRMGSRAILEREIKHPNQSSRQIGVAGKQLQELGYPPQIHKRADRTSFFLIESDRRTPIYVKDDSFESDTGQVYSSSELLERLEKRPEDFSPSAVLRPVIQDAVFPTAAVVLGPGEVAYHSLLPEVYETHGVERPCGVPRTGLTLIDAREKERLERFGLEPNDLKEHPTALVKRIETTRHGEERTRLKHEAETALNAFFDATEREAEATDPTIVKVLQKNRVKIGKEIDRAESLLVRRIAERDKQLHRQIDALRSSLVPNGGLQEREMNLFAYLLKYGPKFLTNLKCEIEAVEDGSHVFLLVP